MTHEHSTVRCGRLIDLTDLLHTYTSTIIQLSPLELRNRLLHDISGLPRESAILNQSARPRIHDTPLNVAAIIARSPSGRDTVRVLIGMKLNHALSDRDIEVIELGIAGLVADVGQQAVVEVDGETGTGIVGLWATDNTVPFDSVADNVDDCSEDVSRGVAGSIFGGWVTPRLTGEG